MAIMNTSVGTVQTNVTEAVEFSFSRNNAAKLAAMFSSYVYSDKEYAVISELAANAIDAHKMVGKDSIPISVSLPNKLTSEFIIRDFGPGMSEEDVVKFLTTYGETSKSNTNDFIGSWGIGSKSPAAVTPTWSIISYHGGKKKHYQVFLNSESLPSLKKLFEVDTEESGLEVRVPLQDKFETQNAWNKAAIRAFKHYTVQPKVTPELHFTPVKYLEKNDDFGWVLSSQYTKYLDGQKVKIITTMREYYLDESKFDSEFSDLIKLPINLFFSVGEIDLSISREQIQYTDRTIAAIKAKLNLVQKSIEEKISEAVKIDDYIEFFNKIYSIFEKDYLTNSAVETIINKLLTKANKFGLNSVREAQWPSINLDIDKWYNDDTRNFNYLVFKNGETIRREGSRRGDSILASSRLVWVGKQKVVRFSFNISIHDSLVEVIRDTKDTLARVKASGDKTKTYVITEVPFLKKAFPKIQQIKGSSLDRAKRQPKDTNNFKSDYYVITASNDLKKIPESDIKLLNGKVVGVELVSARGFRPNAHLITFEYNFLQKKYGYTIIGYKKGSKPISGPSDVLKNEWETKYKNHPAYNEMLEYYKQTIKAHEVSRSTTTSILISNYKYLTGDVIDLIKKEFSAIIKASEKSKYYTNNIRYLAPHGYYEFEEMFRIMNRTEIDRINKYVERLIQSIKEKYPLLQYLGSGTTSPEASKAIQEYINFIEKRI